MGPATEHEHVVGRNITASLSPRRGEPGPVAHDCFEAWGRGYPRSCSKGAGVDAQFAACGNEGDVSLVELGSDPVESNPKLTVENKQNLFPIRTVSDTYEVGRDLETPGAQLTTST